MLAGLETVGVHREAHRAALEAPLEACLEEALLVAERAGAAGEPQAHEAEGAAGAAKGEKVVDADFEEVKDEKK